MDSSAVAAISGVDLLQESRKNLIAISFPKSRSASYEAAKAIAQGATLYDEKVIGGTLFHFAVFGRHKEDAERALAIINYLRSFKGVQVYAGGKVIQNIFRVKNVVTCYLESLACNDWRAHCFKVVDNPFTPLLPLGKEYLPPVDKSIIDEDALLNGHFTVTIELDADGKIAGGEPKKPKKRYIFPCALLYHYSPHCLNSRHPSSLEDQLQAGAIKAGCDWCPHFDEKNFKKIQ